MVVTRNQAGSDQRKAENDKRIEEEKKRQAREKRRFERPDNIIRRNDIIVDTVNKKIKLEPEEVVVKEEVPESSEIPEPLDNPESSETSEPLKAPEPLEVPESLTVSEPVETPEHLENPEMDTKIPEIVVVKEEMDIRNEEDIQNADQLGDIVAENDNSDLGNDDNHDASGHLHNFKALQAKLNDTRNLLNEREKQVDTLTEENRKLRQQVISLKAKAANDSFRLSQNEKVTFLFKDVLPILVEQGKTGRHIDWAETMPILKGFRLVCKSWRQSADQFLESHPCHLELEITDTLFWFRNAVPVHPRLKLENCQADISKISQLLPYFQRVLEKNPNYNPLSSRHLYVRISPFFNDPLIFISDILKYLEAFGAQIWYCRIFIYGDYENAHLPELLRLLPNLKSLTFCVSSCYSGNAEGGSPFIHLKNLVTVQSLGSNDVLCNFLRKNDHIQKLRMEEDKSISNVMSINLPNLSDLRIVPWEGRYISKDNINCEWTPVKFAFSEESRTYCSGTLISASVSLSRCFREKLEAFTLSLLDIFEFTQLKDILDLPNLKHLDLTLGCFDIYERDVISILLKMKKLETMYVKISPNKNALAPRSIIEDSLANIKSSFKSNFWIRFTRLKRIRIAIGVRKFTFCRTDQE